ncbi:MAG: hypothetical protein J6S92_03090, partial [Oscillospiraceae bacterium]|nr:hypothetical protein [Oscillospiraceae bacterium]
IEIVEREILADHQIQYVQFKFTFDGDWKRFHKVVQFAQCDEVYTAVLGVSGTSCYLPAELHAGAAKMSVFGYDTESDTTVRATTVPVTLNIRESGFEGNDPPIPPTPDLYTQLLKKIENAEHGLDGKSAYEIAVAHGYVGTEGEWLASLHGKDGVTPDMSEYPKTTEVQTIVETVIQPVVQEAHSHANLAVLDSITEQYMQDEAAFRASMANALHGLTTGLSEVSAQTHSHSNKAVLDTITEQYLQDETAFRASTANALHGLTTGLSEVSAQTHSHPNKAVLDNITQEMLDDIASISTVVGQAHWHHNLTTLNGITDSDVTRWNDAYTAAMNLNERVIVNEGVFERFKTEIVSDMQGAKTSIKDILTRLSAVEETLSGVEDALADIVEVTA